METNIFLGNLTWVVQLPAGSFLHFPHLYTLAHTCTSQKKIIARFLMVFLVMIYLASVHLMGGKGSTITDRLVADKGQHEGGREISIPALLLHSLPQLLATWVLWGSLLCFFNPIWSHSMGAV